MLGYGLLIVRFSSDLLSTIEQVDGIVREAACIANVRHTFILDLESVWSIAQSCMIAVTQVAHEGYALGRRPENDVDCRPNQEDQKAVDDRLPSSLADAHPRILVINALSAASRSARVNHLRADLAWDESSGPSEFAACIATTAANCAATKLENAKLSRSVSTGPSSFYFDD